MADNTEAHCQQCEIVFKDEEDIIGITGAKVSNADDSILPDDQSWIALYHEDCWKIITDLIKQVIGVTTSDALPDKTGNTGQSD